MQKCIEYKKHEIKLKKIFTEIKIMLRNNGNEIKNNDKITRHKSEIENIKNIYGSNNILITDLEEMLDKINNK